MNYFIAVKALHCDGYPMGRTKRTSSPIWMAAVSAVRSIRFSWNQRRAKFVVVLHFRIRYKQPVIHHHEGNQWNLTKYWWCKHFIRFKSCSRQAIPGWSSWVPQKLWQPGNSKGVWEIRSIMQGLLWRETGVAVHAVPQLLPCILQGVHEELLWNSNQGWDRQ